MGYISLLRQFVAELETATYRRNGLRSLIGPELAPASFDLILDGAERAEAECLQGA